jgi:hypothetical protein
MLQNAALPQNGGGEPQLSSSHSPILSKMPLSYTNDALNAAVQRVLSGERGRAVSSAMKIPYRTLMKWVAQGKLGIARVPRRRGPAPLLPEDAESHLVDWVIGRQHVGHPASRHEIIYKAGTISALTTGQTVGSGWYRRFMERHPTLAARTSEAVSKSRNSVTVDDTRQLFNTLAKVIIENKLDASRVFNMDETAFQTSKGSRRVVAARGSQNVWHQDLSVNFHLTVVACGSAAGVLVPPLFILPGVTVKLTVLDGCKVPGAAVTTTSSGFMNGALFIEWLRFFTASVPTNIKRPLLLIIDGCSSHYSLEVVIEAQRLGVLLVLLPSNATHLLQPLDVAVFASYKARLRRLTEIYIGDTGDYSITKEQAIAMASSAWETSNMEENIAAGFKSCGVFPLSKPLLDKCVDVFLRNGAPKTTSIASWLQIKPVVEKKVLVLPVPSKRVRKTATVGGRLLTRDLLNELAAPPKKAKTRKQKGKKSGGALREAVV